MTPHLVLDPAHATRSARAVVLLIAGLALVVAVLTGLGWGASRVNSHLWQAWILSALSLPLVLGGGAALGPLLAATPTVEPSPLKLGLFSCVLSPALVAALGYGLAFGLGLPPARAWSITFAAIGVLALLGLRSRVAAAPAGRAAGIVTVLGILSAVAACAIVWSPAGLAARLGDSEAVVQATLAQSLQGGAPLRNPWVSGLTLEIRPTLAAWLVAASGPANLLPLFTMGFAIGWSALVIAIAGYLASAALFRETSVERAGLRDVVAATAVLLTAAALDGGRWSVGSWLSMAYSMAFAVAALHAIRRGARPWPGLACLLLGLLGLLHPWLAAGLLVPLAVSALLTRRWNLAPLAVLASLPGFLVARTHGGGAFQQAIPYLAPRSIPGDVGGVLAWAIGPHLTPLGSLLGWMPFGLGALALVTLIVPGRVKEDARVSRAGGVLMLLLVLALVAAVALLPVDSKGEAAGLVGAAVLFASLGLGGVVQWIPLASPAAILAATALLGWLAVPVWRDRARGPGADFPFSEGPWQLTVQAQSELEEGVGAALKFLRSSPLAQDPFAILMREPGPLGPVPRAEPLSLAPLLSGIPLWGGRAASPGSDQARSFAPPRGEQRTELGDTPLERRALLEALFELEGKWHQRFTRVLDAARARGYTLVFLVTEADRRSTTDRGGGPRGVDDVIRRMGAEEVFRAAEASVYVLPGSRP